jgi:hypothetical protein
VNNDDIILDAAIAKLDCQKYAITHHHPAYKYFMDLHDRLTLDQTLDVVDLVPGPPILHGFLEYVI